MQYKLGNISILGMNNLNAILKYTFFEFKQKHQLQ
jgi:hypothetical protein